ncbi:MAG TPA: Ig-like domain-containing protein [Candidatus Udaeobacter sp.]|nr:Ig-like domain-containing protein [Candidatus Udaeobacter sp.]
MNGYHDPELDDVLQDDELRRIATLLGSAHTPEPPLDDAYRTGLRRQLMQQAWSMAEGRQSWWRRAFAPPGLAWVGAAAGVVLIALVAVQLTGQGPQGAFQVVVTSPVDGGRAVALQQPILVKFNQPMDHPSTEAAVQITPATQVAYSWEGNTLQVLPTSGNLAPNTQYQVTIGSGAKTASQQSLAQPQTITFVTQPPATPTPVPTPRPTPTSTSLLTGEKQIATVATLSGGGTAALQWAPDSSAIYYVDAKSALNVVSAKGGAVTVIAPDGASSPAVSPAGDKLAYIRGGKIEVLNFASGKTDEYSVAPQPTLVGWSQAQLEWTSADGVYVQAANGPKQLAGFPTTVTVQAMSISPDGAHVVYSDGHNVFLLDVTSGKNVQLGGADTTSLSWSPGGSYVLYVTPAETAVFDTQGNQQVTLPVADVSWSGQDAVLLGTDTDLSQVRPDGSALTKLANGTYRSPVWAPDGKTFAFFRGSSIWVATAPALPPAPSALDVASATVTSFMDARLKGQADQAATFLDASGKQAYGSKGLSLSISGEPRFSRYYVLTQELVSTNPDTARFVVRLVLTRGKLDVSDFEETLTLVRDASSKQFLVDGATATDRRELGKGAEVVSVEVAADTVKVTFDSDLDPGTVAGGVILLDGKGNQVQVTPTYANRVVTFTGLDLKQHDRYRLVVLPILRDVAGHNVAAEYDLDLFGPDTVKTPDHRQAVTGSPTPSPQASPSPTPGG